MQAFDRGQKCYGTGGVDDQIRLQGSYQISCCFGAGHDLQVVKMLCTVDQILGKIVQSLFVRNLGDLCSQTTEILFFLNKCYIAADFRCCAGCFETCGTCADNDHFAGLVDRVLFVFFAVNDVRVDRAAKRAVAADTVSDTADVAGNALADGVDIAVFCLIAPFGICDQTAADTDEVCGAVCNDILSNLGIADVADGDAGLVELVLYSLCHVCSPAVLKPVGINLILDGGIQSGRGIKHINFVIQEFQVFQCILYMVSGIDELVDGQTQRDGHSGADCLADFIDDHAAEAGTILSGAAEFIRAIIHGRRKELADQVGVACMDLDHIKAGDLRSLSCCAVILCNAFQLFFGKRARDLSARLGRKSGGRDRLHTDSGAHGRSTGVVDLNADFSAILMNSFCQIQKTGDVAVFIHAELRCSVGTFRILHTDIFDNNQTGAAACPFFVILDVFVGQLSGMAGKIAAHRHHHNAVRQCHSADGDRAEQILEIIAHLNTSK